MKNNNEKCLCGNKLKRKCYDIESSQNICNVYLAERFGENYNYILDHIVNSVGEIQIGIKELDSSVNTFIGLRIQSIMMCILVERLTYCDVFLSHGKEIENAKMYNKRLTTFSKSKINYNFRSQLMHAYAVPEKFTIVPKNKYDYTVNLFEKYPINQLGIEVICPTLEMKKISDGAKLMLKEREKVKYKYDFQLNINRLALKLKKVIPVTLVVGENGLYEYDFLSRTRK